MNDPCAPGMMFEVNVGDAGMQDMTGTAHADSYASGIPGTSAGPLVREITRVWQSTTTAPVWVYGETALRADARSRQAILGRIWTKSALSHRYARFSKLCGVVDDLRRHRGLS
jgi:hypothetical protein